MHPYQVASSQPMTSSKATSPTTTDSPPVLTPATPSTINKPLAPMPGPGISITKTWVLPPKPKPGRKPALDTPPTKRKAQNREAQRAFRERRAAKVGELEEEMKRMEEEDAREQESLRERIRQLENNMEDYGKMLEAWRERFSEMRMACGREMQLRERAEEEADKLREILKNRTEAVALPSRSGQKTQHVAERTGILPELVGTRGENEANQQVSMTCGKCSIDTQCQCIEEAFDLGNVVDEAVAPGLKRPHSPQATGSQDSKRVRQSTDDIDNNEIDFTSHFATPRPSTLTSSTPAESSSLPATAPPDPCGFCSDETPCICAEMAKEGVRHHQGSKQPQSLPPYPKQQPSQGSTVPDPCANGPGTCDQCRSNPTSTLFCKSVAANRSSFTDSTASQNSTSAPAPTGPALTCADAFTTLSRHPAFSAATDEFNTWIPQLTAIPRTSSAYERTAFDIEAASVMSVLKLFDRRFGSQGEKIEAGNR